MSENSVPLPHALQLTAALAQLAHIAGDLPTPQTMDIRWDHTDGCWIINGFLFTLDGDQADIDAIRAWDRAIGGRLYLEEPHSYAYTNHTSTSRRLRTTAELFGVHVILDAAIDEHVTHRFAEQPQAVAA